MAERIEIAEERWLHLRPSDLEMLKSAVGAEEGRRYVEDTLQKVLGSLDGSTEQGAYDAFVLGAHMLHVLKPGRDLFAKFSDAALNLADRYFLDGVSGRPFRVIEAAPHTRAGTAKLKVFRRRAAGQRAKAMSASGRRELITSITE